MTSIDTRPATRDTVEAHIAALDVMLDWAEKHDLTLTNLHATWFLHGYDEATVLPVLLDGAEPGTVQKVEGVSSHHLVRDFGAGVTLLVPLAVGDAPDRTVTVLNPGGGS